MRKKKRRPRYYPEPKSPELRVRNDEMVKARMFGATIRNIARHFNLSRTHAHAIVAGVLMLRRPERRPRKSRARPERALHFLRLRCEARELRRLGYSYREIAERLGISCGLAFNAAHMVRIAELRGRAWLSHREGRPKAWKRELLARSRTRPPGTPLAEGLASAAPGYAAPS